MCRAVPSRLRVKAEAAIEMDTPSALNVLGLRAYREGVCVCVCVEGCCVGGGRGGELRGQVQHSSFGVSR